MAEGSPQIRTSTALPGPRSAGGKLDHARAQQRLSKSFKHGQSGPLSQTQPNTSPLPAQQAAPAALRPSPAGPGPQSAAAKANTFNAVRAAAQKRRAMLQADGKAGIMEGDATTERSGGSAGLFSLWGLITGFISSLLTGPHSETTKKARSMTFFGFLSGLFGGMAAGPAGASSKWTRRLLLWSIMASLLVGIVVMFIFGAVVTIVIPDDEGVDSVDLTIAPHPEGQISASSRIR